MSGETDWWTFEKHINKREDSRVKKLKNSLMMEESRLSQLMMNIGLQYASLTISSPLEVLFTLRQVQFIKLGLSPDRPNKALDTEMEDDVLYENSTERKLVQAERYLLNENLPESLGLFPSQKIPVDALPVDGLCRPSDDAIIEKDLSQVTSFEGLEEIIFKLHPKSLFKGNFNFTIQETKLTRYNG